MVRRLIPSMENSRRTKGNGDNENHEASNKSSIYEDNASNIDLRATAVRGKPIDDNNPTVSGFLICGMARWYHSWKQGGHRECLHCTIFPSFESSQRAGCPNDDARQMAGWNAFIWDAAAPNNKGLFHLLCGFSFSFSLP